MALPHVFATLPAGNVPASDLDDNFNAVTQGPGSSTSGDLPSFADTSGKILQDSGVAAAALVTAPVAMTSHGVVIATGSQTEKTIAVGTTGQVLKGITGADPVFGTLTGTLTAGTTNTLNPFALSTTNTQAHGLGAVPQILVGYLQNVTAELGYNSGDIVFYPFFHALSFSADATNTYIVAGAAGVSIINRSTNALTAITNANWKVVCVPYKIN